MTPKEPYLIRAFHQWILDNDCTPYLVVDTFQPNVSVPTQFIQPDGQITLNIAPEATGNLCLGDAAIEFNARFGGQPHHLFIPCYAVLAIFAKETGDGTGFEIMPADERAEALSEVGESQGPKLQSVKDVVEEKPKEKEKEKKKASHLSVVK
jgi:stringent starvation protein B